MSSPKVDDNLPRNSISPIQEYALDFASDLERESIHNIDQKRSIGRISPTQEQALDFADSLELPSFTNDTPNGLSKNTTNKPINFNNFNIIL